MSKKRVKKEVDRAKDKVENLFTKRFPAVIKYFPWVLGVTFLAGALVGFVFGKA